METSLQETFKGQTQNGANHFYTHGNREKSIAWPHLTARRKWLCSGSGGNSLVRSQLPSGEILTSPFCLICYHSLLSNYTQIQPNLLFQSVSDPHLALCVLFATVSSLICFVNYSYLKSQFKYHSHSSPSHFSTSVIFCLLCSHKTLHMYAL